MAILKQRIAALLPSITSDSPAWPIGQQFVVRGLLALKFFAVAQILSPIDVGLVAFSLLILGVVESASETGLSHAVVQAKADVDARRLGAVATLQFARGIVIGLVLIAISLVLTWFGVTQSVSPELFLLAAVLPVVKNAVHINYIVLQRTRSFRRLAGLEIICVVVDCGVAITLLLVAPTPSAVLIGSIVGECGRVGLSWAFKNVAIELNFDWSSVAELGRFGRWIWASSLLSAFLNQFDKLLVAGVFGPVGLGIYQVASRIAQLFIADLALAYSAYLFPFFSSLNRLSRGEARDTLLAILRKSVPLLFFGALVLSLAAEYLVGWILSESWRPAVPVLRVASFGMFFGAVIAILAAYAKGAGFPESVTRAVLVQLIVLGALAAALVPKLGLVGMAFATLLSLIASAAVLLNDCFRKK